MKKICPVCKKEFETNRSARAYCSRVCANVDTGKTRAASEIKEREYNVWSSGGGVQSTAIAVLIVKSILPKPDYGVMMDCGFESAETLEYVQHIVIPSLADVGVPFEIIDSQRYTNIALTDGAGHVNIPAYKVCGDGRKMRLSTRCNNAWKVRVGQKWMREHGINNCINWIGISTDEEQRQRSSPFKWVRYWYPLIEMGYSREDCIRIINDAGWPIPYRTSCIFCPGKSDGEWRYIKANRPEEWQAAIKIERQIQKEVPGVFINWRCKPLDSIF